MVLIYVFGFAKYLNEGSFLEQGEAENLGNCVEAGVDVETFLEDGDEHIDQDGDQLNSDSNRFFEK